MGVWLETCDSITRNQVDCRGHGAGHRAHPPPATFNHVLGLPPRPGWASFSAALLVALYPLLNTGTLQLEAVGVHRGAVQQSPDSGTQATWPGAWAAWHPGPTVSTGPSRCQNCSSCGSCSSWHWDLGIRLAGPKAQQQGGKEWDGGGRQGRWGAEAPGSAWVIAGKAGAPVSRGLQGASPLSSAEGGSWEQVGVGAHGKAKSPCGANSQAFGSGAPGIQPAPKSAPYHCPSALKSTGLQTALKPGMLPWCRA